MKRDKQWWGRLTGGERIWLVNAERNDRSYGSAYLPDDCSECGVCGNPQLGGGGMCGDCCREWKRIVDKASAVAG